MKSIHNQENLEITVLNKSLGSQGILGAIDAVALILHVFSLAVNIDIVTAYVYLFSEIDSSYRIKLWHFFSLKIVAYN